MSARARGVWAVLPARNEEKTIALVVKETGRYVERVVVVDDGSTDSTGERAERAGARVLRHIINLGKGAALKTGCDYAASRGAKVLVVLDADAQHNPSDIPRFLKALRGRDIVFSYRKINKNMPAILRLGNKFLSFSVRVLYKINLRDTQSGFRAFTAEAYRKIRWDANDYSMESEMIANAGKKRLKYAEIPIDTVYTDKYKGTTVLDGIKIFLDLLWWKGRR